MFIDCPSFYSAHIKANAESIVDLSLSARRSTLASSRNCGSIPGIIPLVMTKGKSGGKSRLNCTYVLVVSTILLVVLLQQTFLPSGQQNNDDLWRNGETVLFRSGGSLSGSFTALISVIDKVETNNTVVLTVSNPAFGLFLENWDCYAKPLLGRRFLVYTNDYHFGRRISESDGYHVLLQTSTDNSDLKESLSLGTVEYQRLVLARTQLVAQLLEIGKSVLVADNDAVWFANPLPYLEENTTAHIVSNTDGSGLYGEGLCGGFLYLKHTPTTIRVWGQVTREHEYLVARAIEKGKMAWFDESEQSTLNRIVNDERNMSPDNDQGIEPLRVHFLHRVLFPSGRVYFDLKWPQEQNLMPVVVHNDWLIGYKEKLERFKCFGLWRVADNGTGGRLVDANGGHQCAARDLRMEGIDVCKDRHYVNKIE